MAQESLTAVIAVQEALSQASTEELQAELTRRTQAQTAQTKLAKDINRWTAIRSLLQNSSALDLLAPSHTQASCSDTNVVNGSSSLTTGSARCIRCLLMELKGWKRTLQLDPATLAKFEPELLIFVRTKQPVVVAPTKIAPIVLPTTTSAQPVPVTNPGNTPAPASG